MTSVRSKRLAVLIDADNAAARLADALFDEIAKIGEASVRRIYGDFSAATSKGWADTLARHAIDPGLGLTLLSVTCGGIVAVAAIINILGMAQDLASR